LVVLPSQRIVPRQPARSVSIDSAQSILVQTNYRYAVFSSEPGTTIQGAASVGVTIASTADFLPVLWVFYVGTGLVTEVISNNASVILMIPVGVETAQGIGANPFAFVLAVTFAASTAFLGPIGYQTNLIVYGPGGYRFTDYVRVGAPLQLLLSTVTVLGIALFWGLQP